MNRLTIEQVDTDGAIRETADRVKGDSRAGFLTKAAFGIGGLVAGGALLEAGPASAASAVDVDILNFALTLEYLEMNFYASAIRTGATGKGTMEAFVKTAHAHETDHVNTLKKALGSAAIKQPTFDFGVATTSAHGVGKFAVELEDTGVRAYKGQAPNITETAVLAVALSIHSVEANHSAWIRYILGKDPTYTGAFEKPLTKAEVLKAVEATGFITSM
jgi:hypothetical protein